MATNKGTNSEQRGGSKGYEKKVLHVKTRVKVE